MQKGRLYVQTTCFQDNDAIRRNDVFCRRREKEASCRKEAINHQNLQTCYNYLYKIMNCLYNLYKQMNCLYKKKLIICTKNELSIQAVQK